MEWSSRDVGRTTGVTSRTLRHYDAIGLLRPTRTGSGGYRYYDEACLIRLQQILLLRELGLDLATIGNLLDDDGDDVVDALQAHLRRLRDEQHRLERIAASVSRTITMIKEGGDLVPEQVFDGFDHTQYRDEVQQRWGKQAWASGDRWWRSMSDAERTEWTDLATTLAADWVAAAETGAAPDSDVAQQLAARHVAWLGSIPGAPTVNGRPAPEYVTSLGEMYVADERFAANYGGTAGAALVRDALRIHLDRP